MKLADRLRDVAEQLPVPPPGDPAATFRRGRRRRRRRHAGIAVAATAGVIAVSALGLPMLPTDDPTGVEVADRLETADEPRTGGQHVLGLDTLWVPNDGSDVGVVAGAFADQVLGWADATTTIRARRSDGAEVLVTGPDGARAFVNVSGGEDEFTVQGVDHLPSGPVLNLRGTQMWWEHWQHQSDAASATVLLRTDRASHELMLDAQEVADGRLDLTPWVQFEPGAASAGDGLAPSDLRSFLLLMRREDGTVVSAEGGNFTTGPPPGSPPPDPSMVDPPETPPSDQRDRPSTAEPTAPVMVHDSEVVRLAAAPTNDPSLQDTVIADTDELAELWQRAGIDGEAAELPEGTVGLFVVARQAESTCRSTGDVTGVEIHDGDGVVLLDPAGEFLRPCPGPEGSGAWTAFVVAIPDRYGQDLTEASTRLAAADRGSGGTGSAGGEEDRQIGSR